MFPYEDTEIASVCPYLPYEKKSPLIGQYQSYISNCCINGMVFTNIYFRMETQQFDFLKEKNINWNLACAEITQALSISILQ